MDQFIDIMSEAITGTDGTEGEAFALFELNLLTRGDPELVWQLFEPVRLMVLRRLYRMAQYRLDNPSEAESIGEASSKLETGMASEPLETADSPHTAQQSRFTAEHSAVSPISILTKSPARRRKHSPRNQTSVQEAIMNVGGRKSHLDWITNNRGLPIGDCTYIGLENFDQESPIVQRYARRLMETGLPKTGRSTDVVRRFITPDEADRIWSEMLREVA
jgi:hypothetical protein